MVGVGGVSQVWRRLNGKRIRRGRSLQDFAYGALVIVIRVVLGEPIRRIFFVVVRTLFRRVERDWKSAKTRCLRASAVRTMRRVLECTTRADR